MSRILHFVREKAFVLILLGSILAALGTGIWAIRTVQQNLSQSSPPQTTQQQGLWDSAQEGDGIWDEPADIVTDEMNGEIAMEDTPTTEPVEDAVVYEPDAAKEPVGQASPDTPSDSSTQSPGASSLSEPFEPSGNLPPQETAVTPSFVMPVTGLVTQLYSGDELVYNETLGDWRTHNGMDYAATIGEAVIAPVAGEVTAVYTDGNWGGVVELRDDQGYTWRFCGVENSTLQVGEKAIVGQTLGEIGIISAESLLEPHLHLEIVLDGVYQDPSDHLR